MALIRTVTKEPTPLVPRATSGPRRDHGEAMLSPKGDVTDQEDATDEETNGDGEFDSPSGGWIRRNQALLDELLANQRTTCAEPHPSLAPAINEVRQYLFSEDPEDLRERISAHDVVLPESDMTITMLAIYLAAWDLRYSYASSTFRWYLNEACRLNQSFLSIEMCIIKDKAHFDEQDYAELSLIAHLAFVLFEWRGLDRVQHDTWFLVAHRRAEGNLYSRNANADAAESKAQAVASQPPSPFMIDSGVSVEPEMPQCTEHGPIEKTATEAGRKVALASFYLFGDTEYDGDGGRAPHSADQTNRDAPQTRHGEDLVQLVSRLGTEGT